MKRFTVSVYVLKLAIICYTFWPTASLKCPDEEAEIIEEEEGIFLKYIPTGLEEPCTGVPSWISSNARTLWRRNDTFALVVIKHDLVDHLLTIIDLGRKSTEERAGEVDEDSFPQFLSERGVSIWRNSNVKGLRRMLKDINFHVKILRGDKKQKKPNLVPFWINPAHKEVWSYRRDMISFFSELRLVIRFKLQNKKRLLSGKEQLNSTFTSYLLTKTPFWLSAPYWNYWVVKEENISEIQKMLISVDKKIKRSKVKHSKATIVICTTSEQCGTMLHSTEAEATPDY